MSLGLRQICGYVLEGIETNFGGLLTQLSHFAPTPLLVFHFT